MRYVLDVTPEQAVMVERALMACAESQRILTITVAAMVAGRMPDNARFLSVDRSGKVPEGAQHVNGGPPGAPTLHLELLEKEN